MNSARRRSAGSRWSCRRRLNMDWNIENGYFADGVKIIAGTDEAGRGPLCGPVVAGACILPAGIELPYLNDSKKLTEKRREALYTLIA
ncbi:MAG: hypothetical protein J6C52_14595, partial [Clostridia bacterium]|nr:hypothetical protein [Clostridia bacterium]